MRWFFCLFLCACIYFDAPFAKAQEAVAEPLEIEQSGTDYLTAIRLRRIDAGVGYFDPNAPPPKLETRLEPQRLRDQSGDGADSVNWPPLLITLAVLLVVGYIFVRFGGGITGLVSRSVENAERVRQEKNALADVEVPASLERILGLNDKRQALVLLARNALAATVAANGVFLQRSWTARDALGYIPRDQSNLDALRALVMASERVQFGGRDVSEDEFDAHLSRVRPLLKADQL